MQWLTRHARPTAIIELYETFTEQTEYDLNAACQLRVLFYMIAGQDIREAIEARDKWFRDHTSGGFVENFDSL